MKHARRDIEDGRCSECGANHMDHWPWCSDYARPYPGECAIWTTLEDGTRRKIDPGRVQAAEVQSDTSNAEK
jgi:hypothetical protein